MEQLTRADIDVPCFSLEERDRRWARVREAMGEEGIEFLVLPYNTGHWGQFQADTQYITQLGDFEGEVAAVFPREGELTAWVQGDVYAVFWRACQDWVSDIRGSGGRWSEVILARLRELGAERARIGIVGLGGLVHAREGIVDHRLVDTLRRELPHADIVNATPMMQRVRYVKSDEEVDALRRAVAISERAIADAARLAVPGVPDREVYAEVLASMVRNGGWLPTLIVWRAAPDVSLAYHYPTNRPLAPGDIIFSEIEGKYLGYRGQIWQPIAVGHLKAPYEDLLQASIDAFNHTAPLMRPGVTFRELWDAFTERAGGLGPPALRFNVQSRGIGEDWPLILGGQAEAAGSGHGTADVLDTPLARNATLAIKHSASLPDPPRTLIWSDMVLVTPQGGERLGTRPQGILIGGG